MSGAKLGAKPIAVAPRPYPREEDPLLSEPVTQSAGDQGQGRERQELGVHHPLQVERRQAHLSANRRERYRDDGAADEHEAAAQARRGEHLCAALRADGLRLGERQAAVGQDQGRAAHDLIPQVRSSDSRRASRDMAGSSAWMRAETIAATQKATIIHDKGRTARPPRVLTDEHRQRHDPRRCHRRLQPAVRLSNPERVATGSSGALRTDVVSRTAAARTQ